MASEKANLNPFLNGSSNPQSSPPRTDEKMDHGNDKKSYNPFLNSNAGQQQIAVETDEEMAARLQGESDAEMAANMQAQLNGAPPTSTQISEGGEKAMGGDEELAARLQAEYDAMSNGAPASTAYIANKGSSGVNEKAVNGTHTGESKTPFGADTSSSYKKGTGKESTGHATSKSKELPQYSAQSHSHKHHTNPVIEAGKLRAVDEQKMQNWLLQLQYRYRIYNSEVEPEHEADYYCSCDIHEYKFAKYARAGIQDRWNAAVVYPGEKTYNGNQPYGVNWNNPYLRTAGTSSSPYGPFQTNWGPQVPSARFHASWIQRTITLNNELNAKAQRNIDAQEPSTSIWEVGSIRDPQGNGQTLILPPPPPPSSSPGTTKGKEKEKKSGMAKMFGSLGIKDKEERQAIKDNKAAKIADGVKEVILAEENGRWQDQQTRAIISLYQEKTGMTTKIAYMRLKQPIQYLHLLRAGYFEPIPVSWANSNSNPLKFIIEPAEGWRGLTPMWRGYEDTAEERLYWVLNHREGSTGTRLKPDFISAINMARERMERAVPPPPEYYDVNDTCHVQHTSEGYSKQVLPPPFKPFDQPEGPDDDTMILLDISGSMDFPPQRPVYDRYLVKTFENSTQPKNRALAKAIVKRFTDAMINFDHNKDGYDLITFSTEGKYVGRVNHKNLENLWSTISFNGGTRVMTGWQKVKELHFEKHSESAIHHPIFGWQAGPQTPILRLLLLLDGEATDMDEFELDLLGLSWAHVTIFLIGVDGCPHHHRHANELQRISDVNHHVSFVDAQGNTPERFVTHELLKRHLGMDLPMRRFEELETPPAYEA